MKTFRWKVKPDMEVNSQPSVRMRWVTHCCAGGGNNADLKTYRVTLSVTREEARHLEAFLAEHGGWKAFLWKPLWRIPWRDRAVVCAGRGMLRAEFSGV
ncbi:phage tail protein [Escherichia coli]|uniref:phage tail protein n=1 Tax=Escherichia coli TaxID=562 RepID=UPI00388E49B0